MRNRKTVSCIDLANYTDIDYLNERWAQPIGFANYEVSSIGRVRSLARTVNGVVVPGRILDGSPAKGYARYVVRVNSKTKHICAHTLVCLAFIGPRPDNTEIRHLDGNPANNRLSNLAYGTRSENIRDGIKHGAYPKPGKPGTYLTREMARQIYLSPESSAILADKFGVPRHVIYNIRARRTWRPATDDLPGICRRQTRSKN